MSLVRSNTCSTCGNPIREDDWYCSDECEAEAQRRDEDDLLVAVLDADSGAGAER